jgi:hypothetical protein
MSLRRAIIEVEPAELNVAEFQSDSMIGPDAAIVSIRRDQDASVVDDGHDVRPAASSRWVCASRARASDTSSSVSGPFSRSHSATASNPSRTIKARRAARVIHAETLTPSLRAASSTPTLTSGSTVIAIFGEGFLRPHENTIAAMR